MPVIKPEQIGPGGRNICAFLDMVAFAEGTIKFGQAQGYNVIVGGSLFDDYADHPRKSIHLPKLGIYSTAAGRYQFRARTWDDVKGKLSLLDFSPINQDKGAIQLLREQRALEDIKAGAITRAIYLCKNIWASLPGAGYGQRELAAERLIDYYRKANGQ